MFMVARILMGHPQLLLLDEPSEGLAPVIVAQLTQAVVALKDQGLSVLLSEQNLGFALQVCDRVYIMESGQIRYQGSRAELQDNPGIRQRYMGV